MILPALISFSIGFVVILFSAQALVRLTQHLAAKWRFSPLFISLVVVSLGTNLPELAVTLAALTKGDTGLALGNLIGSVVANSTLVFGATAFFGAVHVGTTKTPKNASLLLLVTLLFVGLQFSDITSVSVGLVLLVAFILALSYQYLLALRGRQREDRKLLELIKKISTKQRALSPVMYGLILLASVVGLGVGGNIAVVSLAKIAVVLGISTTVLGLTLTSIATSLPELLTVVLAAKKHRSKVIIGTVIGSNIFNLTLFPALVLITSRPARVSFHQLLFLLLVSLFLAVTVFTFRGKTVHKVFGLVGFLIFSAFVLAVFFSPM